MRYRLDKKNGQELSVLGYGCMRFPRRGGRIDMAETERQILRAIEGGVNYFDTAYIYPGSEAALGEILYKNGLRDKVYIASKLPHYLMKNVADMEKCFQEQLDRLKTDRIDYYLMHMLPDVTVWQRLKSKGILDWLEEKRCLGAIRSIGFSYHGNSDKFIALLNAHDWDFCQIQYNYLDERSQAGRRGLNAAAAKGIPVMIMEPLRGGRLTDGLPEKARAVFRDARPERSPAEWALRWLWDQEPVTVVLSGMNTMATLEENMAAAGDAGIGDFGPEEKELFRRAVAAINEKVKIGCTGCGYCMPCPAGVDIPGVFRCYNEKYVDGWFAGLKEYVMCTTIKKERSNASLCKKCGKCERHCPQSIEIRKELARAAKELEGVPYKAASWVIDRFVKL